MFSLHSRFEKVKRGKSLSLWDILSFSFFGVPSHRTSVKKPMALVVEGNYEAPVCSGSRALNPQP